MLLNIETRLARLLGIAVPQVKNSVALLDSGATVPFIARYRKEVTGGLNDTQLRELAERLIYLRELDERRTTIINSISAQGKLDLKLEQLILAADNKTTLEDLYLPYKPKRRTKAKIAKEAGLEPLATALLTQKGSTPEVLAAQFLNPQAQITTITDALEGARYIILDIFAENASLLAKLRARLSQEAVIHSKIRPDKEEIGAKYRDYFSYQELLKTIPSHRALAILRAANEEILAITIEYPELQTLGRGITSSYENLISSEFLLDLHQFPNDYLKECVRLAWKSKIFPALENELLNQLQEQAEDEAIKVFAHNLRDLLLQAPALGKTTLGLDPGIRTGVKAAIIDHTGKLLSTTTIYPFTRDRNSAIKTLAQLCSAYKVELISIGNGTASRETQQLATDMLQQFKDIKATVLLVSEAGASIYSASAFAAQELPELDVSLRGAVSIARRVLDPLAELVKIDPKAIGIGQYQHDVNQKKLAQSLDNVVEDCVNRIGVDLNTASVPLLARVAGLNPIIADNIVSYRNDKGKFNNRKQLLQVPRLGEKTFEQCAGFLRINNGSNPLDGSAVHPESYPLVEQIAAYLGVDFKHLIANTPLLRTIAATKLVSDHYGLPTIQDVLKELEKPGRDPRGEFKSVCFREGINAIADLVPGMELEGVISNIANFGAFVDIGVHQDGLVHISAICEQYITNPHEVLKVGQIVKVRVEEVDLARKRIALSMKGLNSITPKSKLTNKPNKLQAQRQENSISAAFAKLKQN
jgi:uncharacterized protein